MKFEEWLNTWLTLYVKPISKSQTYTKYSGLVRKRIVPALGKISLEELTSQVLQSFVVEEMSLLSNSTVNSIITVLQKSLKMAVMLGEVDKHNADKIIRPKVQENKAECFTSSEQKKIEKAVFESKKAKDFGVVLCLYTGLRIGELLALTWADVDLVKGLLSVNKSCHYGRSESGEYVQIVDSPKTAQSIRVIPLPKQLLPNLRNMKRNSDCKFVISSHGKPIATRTYQKFFESLLRKLNIEHKGFHALRHTFATRALECGMDVKTLSEILGHKNAEITLNRYAHSMLEHKTKMMNILGKLLQ